MMSILDLKDSDMLSDEFKLELKIRQFFYYLDICHEEQWLISKNIDPVVDIIIEYCGTY